MYVYELVQPGCWLEGFDEDEVKRDVEALLRLLSNCVDDAALALSLFEGSQASVFDSPEDRMGTWEEDRERERAIEIRLEQGLPSNIDFEARFRAMDQIRETAKQEAKRQKWQEGQIPDGYRHRLPFLHAKTCVYALDTLQKAMRLLADTPGVPAAIPETLRDFQTAFPDLVHVRDSSHHAEDRVQGKKRSERIEPKPLTNGAVHAPSGGVLIVDMLNGRRYGGTLADGAYGEVEISPETVAIAQGCVQRVLNAFAWTGPAMHMPR